MKEETKRNPLLTLPNTITIGRLCLVPVTLYFVLQGQTLAAFWLFLLAGVSDAIDGIIARLWKVQSEVGAMLDPLADKALLVGVYITLAIVGILPDWLVWLVVARDVLIVAGYGVAWLWRGKMPLKPSYLSKINTTMQIVLAATTLAITGYDLALDSVIEALIAVVAATTMLSLAGYAVRWGRHVAVGKAQSR